MFDIDSLENKEFEIEWIAPLSEEWFSPIKQRFSFSFDEETSSFAFRIEWGEFFLFEKEEIRLEDEMKQNLSLDKERLGLMSDE